MELRSPVGQRRYAALAMAVVAAHAVVGTRFAWIPYVLASVAATLATYIGVRRQRPSDRRPWVLLITGLAVSSAGSVIWYALEWAGHDPSPAHGVYLVAYACSVTAVWQLGRHRPTGERTATLLDTAIVTTGVAILMWVFVAGPTWGSALVGVERFVRAAYPMINLAMLAALLRLAFGGGVRVRAYWLLVGGLAGLFTADLLSAVFALNEWAAGPVAGTLRLAAFSFVGVAALDPTMVELTKTGPRARVNLSRPRLALLWVTSAAAPVTLVAKLGAGARGELVVIALGSLALFSLVIARMWGLLRMLADFVRREHEDRFRALVENTDDVIFIADPDGVISYVSPSCRHIWGYDAEQLAGDVWNLMEPGVRQRMLATLRELSALPNGESSQVEGRFLHADGGARRFEATLVNRTQDPAIKGVIITARDVTARRELEAQLAHSSFHDLLTGLPNRTLFVERIAQALQSSREAQSFSAVLILDVDDFKSVNDTLGHERGDELLRIIGRRLVKAVRSQTTVARLGGDEFGILLPNVTSLHAVSAIATRLLEAIAHPAPVGRARLEPRASLGIATSTDASSADDLLRDADAAMYAAKRQDKGSFRLFDAKLHAQAVDRLELKVDLRTSVDREELTVVYQPIHELSGERLVGVEALLRWQHPTRGTVSPVEFIPLAEESGSIGLLGEFVLRRACSDIAAYRRTSGLDVFVTVNVSPLQLFDPGFARSVISALEDSGLPASRLTLELTESIFLEQSDEIDRAVHRLREVGIRLAIDDFGTGYCSLGYLQRFRFDAVKIDKSFIDMLAESEGDRRLTIGIVELIGSLEVPAVAEGVETRAQLEILQAAGTPFAQGYLFSRPVPIDQLPLSVSPVEHGHAPSADTRV